VSHDKISAGDALRIDPVDVGIDHLWIVLSTYSTCDDYEFAIIVSITSIKTNRYDNSCILTPFDIDRHPFVVKKSYVLYDRAIEKETSWLLGLPDDVWMDSVSPDLLKRIRIGFHKSPHSKRRLKSNIPKE
jgi:hypothetical protein